MRLSIADATNLPAIQFTRRSWGPLPGSAPSASGAMGGVPVSIQSGWSSCSSGRVEPVTASCVLQIHSPVRPCRVSAHWRQGSPAGVQRGLSVRGVSIREDASPRRVFMVSDRRGLMVSGVSSIGEQRGEPGGEFPALPPQSLHGEILGEYWGEFRSPRVTTVSEQSVHWVGSSCSLGR